MKNRKEIQEELKSFGITWAATDPCAMPYTLPTNYFEEGVQPLIADLQAGIEPNLNNLAPKSTPYSLPENYFQELPQNIMTAAIALQNVQSMIHQKHPSPTTTQPEVLVPLVNTVSKKQTAWQRLGVQRWMMAASIAGLLCTISFYFWMKTDATHNTVQVVIPSSIPDAEILNFLEQSHQRGESATIQEETLANLQDENETELLKEVSDEELFAYAAQNSNTFN